MMKNACLTFGVVTFIICVMHSISSYGYSGIEGKLMAIGGTICQAQGFMLIAYSRSCNESK